MGDFAPSNFRVRETSKKVLNEWDEKIYFPLFS